MTADSAPFQDSDPDDLLRPLVRYFHDCLAAQSDWGRALNVIDQPDVTLLPLAAHEQAKLGLEGSIRFSDASAIELGKKALTEGSDVSLQLGALFLVGCLPKTASQAERRFCGPVLEVAVTLQQEPDGQVILRPEEDEFSVNYSMLAELLGSDDDELQDRLEDLSELVPDFPIDPVEFETFWRGFRMITPDLAIDERLPDARRDGVPDRLRAMSSEFDTGPFDNSSEGRSPQPTHRTSLQLIDFFVPAIPSEGFRMLPATAVVLGPKAGRSMSALAELRRMDRESLGETAFGCLFDPLGSKQPVFKKSDRAYPDEVLPLPLTPAQAAIVDSARSAPLTVVTGPPGTGKSHTITAITLDALMHGQTVLVASQMDKAVEVVANRVEALIGEAAIARSGGRAAQRVLAAKISALTGPRKSREETLNAGIDQLGKRHYEMTRQLQEAEHRYQQAIAAERRWSQAKKCLVREQRPEFALSQDFKAGSLSKVNRMLAQLRQSESSDPGLVQRWRNVWSKRRLRRLLHVPADHHVSLRDLEQLRDQYILLMEMQGAEESLGAGAKPSEIFDELLTLEHDRRRVGLELVRQTRSKELRTLVNDGNQRGQLRDLATSLRRRRHELKRQLQEKISAETMLRAFPIWACTTRSLCEVLPPATGLFDLVVIDEASQCDLALAAVALMRAKRVVVVGDPHQLRRVCFLSRAREQAALTHHQVSSDLHTRYSYRRSLFDVAADEVDGRHFYFLDEHFRSHPQIIGFSNRQFYDCDLRIMTSRPSTVTHRVIKVCNVDGRRSPESSVNQVEIDAIIAEIRSRASATSDGTLPSSIGVVSPFRDQVDAIRERLIHEFSAHQIANHSIVVGTAHAFQGDEKDVMYFSTSIDTDSHPASLRFLESPNLFNVAITRARRELVIVTSVTAAQLSPGLLREYLLYAEQGWTSRHQSHMPNEIESMIVHQLQARGLPTWVGFESAGSRIDVATTMNGQFVAIMCEDQRQEPLTSEWRTLEINRCLSRAGWCIAHVSHRLLETRGDRWLDDLQVQIAASR